MKVYLVMDAINGENYRVFTMEKDAENFILEQYKKYLEWEKEHFADLHSISLEKAKVYFEQLHGIEDFMYIEELALDDFSDIEW